MGEILNCLTHLFNILTFCRIDNFCFGREYLYKESENHRHLFICLQYLDIKR